MFLEMTRNDKAPTNRPSCPSRALWTRASSFAARPKSRRSFLDSIKTRMAEALQNDALLHGQRAQNMFEALVVSLGKYKLFKLEDTGRVHPESSFTAPDFRLVLKDGRQWLIEAKNVRASDPFRQRLKLRKADVAKLVAYAEAVGCPLKFALYWSLWRMWTLVDASDLVPDGDKLTIEMLEAAPLSELGDLGDRTVGTTPPLVFRVIADPDKERSIAPDGEVSFTIAEAKLLCADREITDPVEQSIAWIFMQYGEWECSEPTAILSGDVLEAVELVWTPRERSNPDERFEIIGRLSTMFAAYYAEQTIVEDALVQTEADLVPDWFKPFIDASHKSDALPLWRFALQRSTKRNRAQDS